MAPSAWYIVIFFLIMFMLLQYMFLLFNEAGVRELYNPYDIFGVWLGEPSFGPRKYGCNQYQQLSAGIDVDILNYHSVGGSFAARWARMVLKRCSSERGEREKRFYGDGKDERRRTAF